MDSCFSHCELSGTKHNASCSIAVNEYEPFCVSANKAPETLSYKSTDCKVSVEPQVNNVKSSEEVGDLNSNAALSYISQLLLEEDTNEKINTDVEELALLATEKAFHDILRQEYYYSPNKPLLHDTANQMNSVNNSKFEKSNDCGIRELTKNGSGHDVCSCKPPFASEDPISVLSIESITAQQIQKGVEEALKFLPNIGEFSNNKESSGSISGRDHQCKTRKNPIYSDLEQSVGKTPKQIVAYLDEPIRNEILDKVFLLRGQRYIEEDTMLREIMQKQMKDESRQTDVRTSNRATKQDKNQTMEEPVDFKLLLIHCSDAVSANNHSLATQLIYKIRKHSSPNGDWSQRLAYYFADGLEARLAGANSEIYRKNQSEKATIVDFFNAFRTYIVASPFGRALVYFGNQTNLNISSNAQKVHIIVFGIINGFEWPSFFEHLSNYGSSPPKIRITVIEVPEPGFRPRKRVEAIGKRLVDYARSFNIPFEYEGIASKWENVKVEDMKIANDEVVVVNSLIHSEKLSDEAIGTDSPRDIFLNTVRKIKPRIFIHGITNGSYNSPFFHHRFRSALSHYSCLFEMLDSNLPRDNRERLIIERDLLIPKATNAISCEGPERVERPETYKQWHARTLRAGLVPLSVDPMIKKNLKNFVRRYYHKEFVVDDDNGWLLLGWKGRILYGLTTWKSNEV